MPEVPEYRKKYKVVTAVSIPDVEGQLNKYARQGWSLDQMNQAVRGYMIVLTKYEVKS